MMNRIVENFQRFVLLLHHAAQDLEDPGYLLSKIRTHDTISRINNPSVDYSFLLFTEQKKKYVKKHKKLGLILSSLLDGKRIEEKLCSYIDGKWEDESIEFACEALRLTTGLKSKFISVYTGKNLDRKIRLVNYADEIAYWIFQRISRPCEFLQYPEVMKDPHRRELLLDIL